MVLPLAALVLSSLSPSHVVTSTALSQQKIEIIKGKKSSTKSSVKNVNVENAPATVVDNSKAQELDRKSAELDAKSKDLAQREQALQEKQAAADEKQAADEKKQQEKLKAQQKQIEQISNGNDELWRKSADALAGD